jgi:hypothetical protein
MSYVGNTPTQQAFSPAIDYFSGNGSTVAFTLSRPVASVAQVQVVVNNVDQNPSTAFTVSGQTLTFTGAPSTGTNNIYVYYTSPITQVVQPGQGTVTSSSFGTITDFTTTGNTVLGDASTDTLNVGNGGLVKDASGNVGIGTSSPTAKLDVNKGSAGVLANFTDGVNTNCQISTTSLVATVGPTAGSTSLAFQSSGTERARIDSSGNLLVGQTAPALGAIFEVNGAVAGQSTVRYPFIGSSTGTAMVIDGSGFFRASSSSRRYKENVQPIDVGLDLVMQMQPVKYLV